MDWIVADERPADAEAREDLLDAVMGPGRKLVACEALRAGNSPAISLVVRELGSLVGTVRLWPVAVLGAEDVLMLGPLAVAGERAGCGIGTMLMEAALDRAEAEGWGAVILVGDPGYYARFGFHGIEGITMPGISSKGRLLVARELRAGTLTAAHGTVGQPRQPFRLAA